MILEEKVRVVGKSEDCLYRALPRKLMKIQTTLFYVRHDDDPDMVEQVLELDVRDVCVWNCLHSFCHLPADPRCPICRLAKATRKPARTRRAEAQVDEPECDSFGKRIHCDFMVVKNRAGDVLKSNARASLLCASGFLYGETRSLVGDSDAAPELIAACKQLAIAHYWGEPGRSTTHAKAERKRQVVKDTMRALLLQSGLSVDKWTWVVQASCAALNLTHLDEK
eukprot:3820301-Amphidinium_carterae.1